MIRREMVYRRRREVRLLVRGKGVLEAGYEPRPPHYHIAVFPSQYAAHVDRLMALGVTGTRPPRVYFVRRGDTLWGIAQRHGTSTPALRRTNGLSSTRIYPGQALTLPGSPR